MKTHVQDTIIGFLEAGGGRSLIVKGKSGTGKTTFTLQLIETLGKIHDSFYISTRVSDNALYQQFRWLKEKEWRERILDTSRGFLRTILPEQWETPAPGEQAAEGLVAASRKFLTSVYHSEGGPPSRVDRTLLGRMLLQYDLPELAHIYDRVDAVLPRSALVVLDSLEGLAERTDIAPARLLLTFQKDLVEASGVRLVVVLESESATYLDYLADGVVTLQRNEVDDRRVRELIVEKLRGTDVRAPRCLFTLAGGRFRFFDRFAPKPAREIRKLDPLPDPEGWFSTGVPDLDEIIGGGFPRGSNVLIEMVDNLEEGAHSLIMAPILANFAAHHRGVMVIPFPEESTEDSRELLEKAVGPGTSDRQLRVAEKIALDKDQSRPHIITLSFEDTRKDYERWDRERIRLRHETKNPILEVISLETQEARFGEEEYKMALSLSAEVARREGDLIVRISKPGLPSLTQRVANASNVHLKLRRMHGAVVLYGERPQTPAYVVEAETAKGITRPKLIPIS